MPSYINLITPLPAIEVKKRIAVRTEKSTLLAFRGQQRVITRVVDAGENTYAFEIWRAPRSSLEWNMGIHAARVKGIVTERRGRTIVHATTETSESSVIIFILVMVLFFAALGITVTIVVLNEMGGDLTTIGLLMVLSLGVIMAYGVWFFAHERDVLTRILRDCAGGDEAQELTPEQSALYGFVTSHDKK